MSKKVIYYLPISGQLGNQLAILAHLIAFANQYDYRIIYPDSEYLRQSLSEQKPIARKVYFSKILSNKFFSFIIIKLIKYLCFNKNLQAFNILCINKRYVVDEVADQFNPPHFIFITDWMFRFYAGVEAQQEEIKHLLAFNHLQQQQSQTLVNEINKKYKEPALIGVHVRRGDYATWQGGKFFYDLSVYYAKMVQIAAQLDNCVFVICSNEKFQFDNTDNLKLVYVNESAVGDLCALSKCSYIIGPPSTFSGWAAFLGHSLIYFIKNQNDLVSIDKFVTHQI